MVAKAYDTQKILETKETAIINLNIKDETS